MATPKRKIDMDEMARRARAAPKDGKLAIVREPEPEVRPLRRDQLPFLAYTWFLIVEPREPAVKVGSLYLGNETRDVEKVKTTVGRVLDIGPTFGKGRSGSGVALDDDEKLKNLKVGDHVLYARYTGQAVKFVINEDDDISKAREVVILSDSELLCAVSDPARIRYWI